MDDYEWDEKKRRSNVIKHGLDFIDAVEVFDDPSRIERPAIRGSETRCEIIGRIEGMIVFVVYTQRFNRKRIISARRASRHERKIYKTANQSDEK